jgi:hypothetical protein
MSSIHDRDEQAAVLFYAQEDAIPLVAKYIDELDLELQCCMVKTAMYVMYREGGMEAVFANMNACRRAPGAANCDRHFSEKARYRMNTMSQKNLENIIKLAKKAGVDTHNRFYVGGLGRYTDPSAWVSHGDDVLSVARRKNLTVQGAINHQGHEVPPPPPVLMAPDIMQENVSKLLAAEPATAEAVRKNPKKLHEVKERIIDKHTPRWVKKRASSSS